MFAWGEQIWQQFGWKSLMLMGLIILYCKGIYSRSFADSPPSSWHRHERGIFAGCTVSIILFLEGMNIILEYSLQSNASHFLSNGVPLPLLWVFMDDLNLMPSSVQGATPYYNVARQLFNGQALNSGLVNQEI